MKKIDSSQLMKLSCNLYLNQLADTMTPLQISGMYWLCRNLGQYWEQTTLERMESRLIQLLLQEIDMQKKLEGDLDADVPEGLQLWTLSDLNAIANLYEMDEELKHKSKKMKQIKQLMNNCKNWNRTETERKWFHY